MMMMISCKKYLWPVITTLTTILAFSCCQNSSTKTERGKTLEIFKQSDAFSDIGDICTVIYFDIVPNLLPYVALHATYPAAPKTNFKNLRQIAAFLTSSKIFIPICSCLNTKFKKFGTNSQPFFFFFYFFCVKLERPNL